MEDQHGYFILSTNQILAVRDQYQAAFSTNQALSGLFDTLVLQKKSADVLALKLDTSTKESTLASEAIRDKAATDLSIAAAVASGYGAGNNNTDLKDLGRFTYTELRKCTLAKQLTDSKKIMGLINQHAAVLAHSGIDAGMIADLNDDVTQMEHLTVIPQNIIDEHKNDKVQFAALMDEMRKTLVQIDKLMQLYRLKNMNFYLAYTAARKVRHHHLKRKLAVVDTETTTGILELLILDKTTEEPLAGAKLMVAALNLVVESDEDGETYTDCIAPATYQAKMMMDGYATIDFDFVIEAGKTCSKQFLMVND